MRTPAEYRHDPDVVILRCLTLPRVLDVVLREQPTGCPSCGTADLADSGLYCEPCGVFRCPRCRLWRHFDDGGGDSAYCNDCWAHMFKLRAVYARRLVRDLRARR